MQYDVSLINRYRVMSRGQEYLTPEDERAMLIQSKSENKKLAQQARDRLINAHIRLAVKHAIQMVSRIKGSVISMEDLVQEATAALCYALDKFDLNVQVRFATYAKFWINAYLSDHLHKNSYQLNYSMSNDAKMVARMYVKTREKFEHIGLSEEEINNLIAKDLCVSPYVVAGMAPTIMQINRPRELDRTSSVANVVDGDKLMPELADESPRPDQIVEDESHRVMLVARVKSAMRKLKPREKDIIVARHLADDPATLETLGLKWQVSKERIRQLENKALKLLHKELRDLANA